jgi:hypothetical protein
MCRTGESLWLPYGDGPKGRAEKVEDRKAAMDDHRQSGSSIVPRKRLNNPGINGAETAEGGELAKGNPNQQNTSRTQSRKETGVASALERIRSAAHRRKGERFTTLLHHVDMERLRGAYTCTTHWTTGSTNGGGRRHEAKS